MTSHKYLSKKKGAAYSFFSGMSAALVPGIILTVIELIVFAVFPAAELSYQKSALGPLSGKSLSDSYKYISSCLDDIPTASVFAIAVAVVSVITAVLTLRFMSDKRTVNVYYSLGIKRRTLYFTKYFSGVVILTIAPITAVVGGYIVNLSYLGLSWQLSVVYFYIWFGIWVLSILAYTVSAAVFSSVGTVSEGLLYSLGLLVLPTALFFAAETILSVFVPTSVFDINILPFLFDGNYRTFSAASLQNVYKAYNPLLFFSDGLYNYAIGEISHGGLTLTNSSAFKLPSLGTPLVWGLVLIAVAILGCMMFKHRNAENCGFLNTNKILSNAVLFEILFFAATIPLTQTEYYPLSTLFIGSAVIMFVLYIIFEIFLKRNAKLIFKSLYKFAAHAAVTALIMGIASTGFFGYASYIPDPSKIKTAAVSIPANITFLRPQSNYSGGSTDYIYANNAFLNVPTSFFCKELPEMTDKEDIKDVVTLHNMLKGESVGAEDSLSFVTFRYVLDNGSVKSRKVYIKNQKLLEKAADILNAKAVKNRIDTLLKTDWRTLKNDENKYPDATSSGYGAFVYEDSDVTFAPMSLREEYALSLSEQEFYELKDAVRKDLLNLSAADMLGGNMKNLGVLSFTSTYAAAEDTEEVTDIGFENEPSYSEESSAFPDDGENDDGGENDGDIIADETENKDSDDTVIIKKAHYTLQPTANVLSEASNKYNVIVTEKMTNTVNMLKKAELDVVFTSRLTAKRVSFIKLDYKNLTQYYRLQTRVYYRDVCANAVAAEKSWDYKTGEDKNVDELIKTQTENIITDEKKIGEVLSKAQLRLLADDGDFICIADYGDNMLSCYPVSASSVPDYVRNFNYQIKGFE